MHDEQLTPLINPEPTPVVSEKTTNHVANKYGLFSGFNNPVSKSCAKWPIPTGIISGASTLLLLKAIFGAKLSAETIAIASGSVALGVPCAGVIVPAIFAATCCRPSNSTNPNNTNNTVDGENTKPTPLTMQ